jgi:competence CoiA-like predicted nuclease
VICCKLADQYIEASKDTERHADYRCPECQNSVILKAGQLVVAHFAHKADHGCGYGSGETDWHRIGKTWTAKYLRMRGWQAFIEHKLGNRRTDLYAFNPEGFRACFEFQRKDEGEEIFIRTADLAQYCDEVVWVIPFDADLIEKMWRIRGRFAIAVLHSENSPEKSAPLYFREWSPNLLKCDVDIWPGTEEKAGSIPKYYQIEIKSIYGGKYSHDYTRNR